jgi:hypothetical protein
MSEVNIIIRTADRTRKAEVSMSRENTGGDVIQAAIENWKLPADSDYTLVNATTSKTLQPTQALAAGVVDEGHILEIQPVLVAGI